MEANREGKMAGIWKRIRRGKGQVYGRSGSGGAEKVERRNEN